MDPALMHTLSQGFTLYIILAASIALHEFGHAKSADMLGDFLPRSQGRVTLNPLAHLDPIGTGLIPLFMIFFHPGVQIIGWGRPVQISLPHPATRVRDDILITAAGPAMNALIALVSAIVIGLLNRFKASIGYQAVPLFEQVIDLNCLLIAFNLFPIPPLDGSHFMRHLVGMGEEAYQKFCQFGWILLIILINIPAFQHFLGWITYDLIEPLFYQVANFVGGRG